MPAEHIFTWVGWGGVGLIISWCAALGTFDCNSTDTPQVNKFTSVCPVRWKNVSKVQCCRDTDVRSWQKLKGFLPKPMYLKYNDKGQTKMHPGVPEYILYIYIYV